MLMAIVLEMVVELKWDGENGNDDIDLSACGASDQEDDYHDNEDDDDDIDDIDLMRLWR